MIDLSKIPGKGYVLAYFTDVIQFEPYYVDESGIHMDQVALWEKEEPKECHFFSEEVEYRRLVMGDEVKELTFTLEEEEKMDKERVCYQKVWLKEQYSSKGVDRDKLVLVNYFNFNEDDIIYLENYRLVRVEK